MRIWSMMAAMLLALVPAAANAWWEQDWAYRKAITVDTSPSGLNVSGAIGRTTVLVRLHGGNFTFTEALENGADIRFVGSDDKTPLPFHIENYDSQTGIATVWVSVPNLTGGEKQQIWLYYGNKNAPVGEDVAGTFDPDYAAVYHFNDAPGAPVSDRTANGNNTQNPPAGVNDGSIIARGARFPGTGALTIADAASLAMPAAQPFTFSAWVKMDQPAAEQALFARGPFVIGLANGVPFVTAGGARIAGSQPVPTGNWAHVAVTADGTVIRIYVNGVEAGAASSALPALAGPISIGGGEGRPFTGEMDEVRLSRVARPAAMLLAEASNQGSADKLVVFGADEEQGAGGGVMMYILGATPFLDWIVIAICMVLLAVASVVMWTKGSYISNAAKGNAIFMKRFRQMHEDLVQVESIPDVGKAELAKMKKGTLYDIYETGIDELQIRQKKLGDRPLSGEAVEALRSAVDAQVVAENQKLDKWMVILTIAISGGPFIGLLGTVLGVMKTFGGVAMAGDVNVNAIAPGIAAALLATIAGLAAAIPSLFGYNYLNSRITTMSDEMRVFVDRLVTRLAEMQADRAVPPPSPRLMAAE